MKKESLFIRFAYGTCVGRIMLKLLVNPRVSAFMGKLLDSGISRPLINFYIKKYNMDMREYVRKDYTSFNDFFIRERTCDMIRRDFDNELISPCDGMLSIYDIDENSRYRIKNISYSLEELVGDRREARRFRGGICMIFRLAPYNYHRYCYTDSGRIVRRVRIPGILHCVRPAAYERYPVFIQNTREYVIQESDHFERMIQMEIGALLVGRICNYNKSMFVAKGEEKGYFEFGGSTVMMIFTKDAVEPDERFAVCAGTGEETAVRQGERIGSIPL